MKSLYRSLFLLASILSPLLAQDPLLRLNTEFRTFYAQAKADAVAGSGPVLLVLGEQLMLYRNGLKAEEASLRPERYHQLKAVAHVPLTLHLLFSQAVPPARDKVVNLRNLAAAARVGLGAWCSGPVRERQEAILDACLQLLEERLRSPLPQGRLAELTGAMGPLVMANIEEAAGLELDQLDRSVAQFRAKLGLRDWAQVRVVIAGPHMPREGEVTLQYFQKLLGEAQEGGRIIYAEGLSQPQDALALLATHLVDGGVGQAFFKDPTRMHRDLLSDGARKWLLEHPDLAR